ncbi:hypothetical protein L950_0222135 [Sphingobacterium sp. IITKGP-BTPF85]|nr:hypothetical protein L950_0222135 [Sphingobacterium sp. IITKGP-BTPF85]
MALPAGLLLKSQVFPILFVTINFGKGTIEILQNSIQSNLRHSSVARKAVQVKRNILKSVIANFVAYAF